MASAGPSSHAPGGAAATHTDPVCGMRVDPTRARGRLEHEGTTYLFCSPHCLERFRAEPAAYVTGRPAPPPPAGAAEWTCPMHPEIVRPAPGSCPICGM